MGRSVTILAALLGAAFLVSLGVWQLQRLEWKEGVLAEMDARLHGAAVPVPSDPDPAGDGYLRVVSDGSLGREELHVLASTKSRGPVYRVVSPFVLEDGRRVLVDRGTVPTGEKDAERAAGPARLVGNLHWPEERDRFTPPDEAVTNIWYARDVAPMAAALGTEPVLVVAASIQMASGERQGATPLPLDASGIPNDHLGYAITWFGLAAGWIAMAGAFVLRGRPEQAA